MTEVRKGPGKRARIAVDGGERPVKQARPRDGVIGTKRHQGDGSDAEGTGRGRPKRSQSSDEVIRAALEAGVWSARSDGPPPRSLEEVRELKSRRLEDESYYTPFEKRAIEHRLGVNAARFRAGLPSLDKFGQPVPPRTWRAWWNELPVNQRDEKWARYRGSEANRGAASPVPLGRLGAAALAGAVGIAGGIYLGVETLLTLLAPASAPVGAEPEREQEHMPRPMDTD